MSPPLHERFEGDVIAPLLVQHRCAGPAGLFRVEDHIEPIQLDLDVQGEILGFGPRWGHGYGNGLANEPHPVYGKNRKIGGLEAGDRGNSANGIKAGEIGGGEDATLCPLRQRGGFDAGVGLIAAPERRMPQAARRHVADKLTLAAQEPFIFVSEDWRPNAPFAHPSLPESHLRWSRGSVSRGARSRARDGRQIGPAAAFGGTLHEL